MRRLPLATIIAAILFVSCGARPGVTVTIDPQRVPTVLSSMTQNTCNSTSHGDAFTRPEDIPLTVVQLRPPPIMRFSAGTSATAIRGVIYDLDGSISPGGLIEQFTIAGARGTYEPQNMVPGHTYQVLVNVRWSLLVTSGEENHLFRLRIEPP